MNELNPNMDIYSKDLPIWERGQASGHSRPLDAEKLINNIIEIHNILDKYGIVHWLSHGTMLGFYREGGPIAWDDDADLGFLFSQREDPNLYKAIDELISLGYHSPLGDPSKPIDNDNAPYYDLNFIRDGEKCEFWGFEDFGSHFIYDKPRCGNHLKHPEKYYRELQDFEFRGHTFKIPNHIEEWLVMMYGPTWNIPDPNKKYNNQK
jgi:hypothetical protein